MSDITQSTAAASHPGAPRQPLQGGVTSSSETSSSPAARAEAAGTPSRSGGVGGELSAADRLRAPSRLVVPRQGKRSETARLLEVLLCQLALALDPTASEGVTPPSAPGQDPKAGRESAGGSAALGREVPQHVVQDAAAAEIFELV